MISFESKTTTTTPSSPLSLAPQDEGEPTLSFSELLRGASTKKDEKTIQNGALVLALDEEVPQDSKSLKGASLLELLKGERKEESKLALELNPEITKNMTQAELKVLVKDAKEYLKSKIIASEGFKKAEIQALPKTLKGLVQVAQKFDIDISKITLQEVKQSPVPLSKSSIKIINTTPVEEDKLDLKVKVPLEAKTQEGLDSDIDVIAKKASKTKVINLKSDEVQVKNDVKAQEIIKEIKVTPLFKAQNSKEITTQQLVNTKISTSEANMPKRKTDETLKLLLRGETASKEEKGFTADFTVATARVIAPQATSEVSKHLESLLKGDKQESTSGQKLDGLNIAKADSFEIKLNEAKQMTKYISQDVKTAIEDYKSPFTRIKVALNPQRLGSVELTVVQRGKNLHISLSSNNAAINALAMNANDLKLQLTNNGINNASLNFNNNSQSSQQGSFGQQQNPQHEREAREEYNYIQSEEQHEEILSSLEIVVPHYA